LCDVAGNKFGEPLICGFTRSYAARTAGGERREWIKPILFTGGFGQMDARHRKKSTPEVCIFFIHVWLFCAMQVTRLFQQYSSFTVVSGVFDRVLLFLYALGGVMIDNDQHVAHF
jgi:hypothetical protein